MSATKIKSLMSGHIANFEGQNIRQFQANPYIEPMYEAANYELRVYIMIHTEENTGPISTLVSYNLTKLYFAELIRNICFGYFE